MPTSFFMLYQRVTGYESLTVKKQRQILQTVKLGLTLFFASLSIVPKNHCGVVRRVPRRGIVSTTPWYCEYHTVVLRVPRRGSVMNFTSFPKKLVVHT